MLTVANLKKRYRAREVVQDFSCVVGQGEVVGLLGPNGAGKTTCFYMIAGLVKLDGGRITLNERDIGQLPMHERARLGLGYLPQEPSVFRNLSVTDNIKAVLEFRPDLNKSQQQDELANLLDELHLAYIADSKGHSLSGGERRRTEIARALALRPTCLLLDEPFAGIDPISVGEIQRLIAHLKGLGIGILITDHNVRETLGICDRAYILHDGRVLAEGVPQAILDNPKVKEVYLGQSFQL